MHVQLYFGIRKSSGVHQNSVTNTLVLKDIIIIPHSYNNGRSVSWLCFGGISCPSIHSPTIEVHLKFSQLSPFLNSFPLIIPLFPSLVPSLIGYALSSIPLTFFNSSRPFLFRPFPLLTSTPTHSLHHSHLPS